MFKIENFSPLDPIKKVILGSPGSESVLGLVLPAAESLFEPGAADTPFVEKARREHDQMQERLQADGIAVYNMRVIIANLMAARNRSRIQTRYSLLAELKKRVEAFHTVSGEGNLESLFPELECLLDIDIAAMGESAAVAINALLTRCIDPNGRFSPLYLGDPKSKPMNNFMFWRDTMHITGDKMITGRMFKEIRQQEVVLAQMGLTALGIQYTPIERAMRTGSIEGGDVLPMEFLGRRYAVIGQAERTSWSGVEAWFKLHEATFSQSGEGVIPLVVQGPNEETQDQMHLDTFAAQVAPGALLYCEEIARQRDVFALLRKGGDIITVKLDDTITTFEDFARKMATNIYPMTRDEQLAYAPNVLVSGNGQASTRVYITRDGTPEVTKFIEQQAADVVLLQMNDITKMYGGMHCATQEVR